MIFDEDRKRIEEKYANPEVKKRMEKEYRDLDESISKLFKPAIDKLKELINKGSKPVSQLEEILTDVTQYMNTVSIHNEDWAWLVETFKKLLETGPNHAEDK